MTLEIMAWTTIVVLGLCGAPVGYMVVSLVREERRRTRPSPNDAARLERIAVELSEISSRLMADAARRGT